MGLVPQTEGEVYCTPFLKALSYLYVLVNNDATPVKRNEAYKWIGFCSQDNFATMEDTVYENLCFFGESKGLSESRIDLEIDALMIKFGLKPYMYTLAF